METNTAPDTPDGPGDPGGDTLLVDGPVTDLGELEPDNPPLEDDEGRLRLSFSRMECYGTCPAQFRFRYIDLLPGEPSPHLSFGSSIHNALERFYDQKLPEAPSEEDLLSYLYDGWESDGFAGMSREEQARWYRHAQDVLRRFHAREAPTYRLPADVEKWFELPIEEAEATVVGSIDRVAVDAEGGLEVIDYKTSKKVRDRDGVRRSLQLAIYALACQHLYGRLPEVVTLDFVVAGLCVRVPIEEIDLPAARAEIVRVADAVRAERFEPTPNRLCGWCDYRALCPAWDGEGPDLLGPATQELDRLRRGVRRDIAAMRRIEATLERLSQGESPRGESTTP